MTGSQFLDWTKSLSKSEREEAAFREFVAGNMPSFSRFLIPITLKSKGRSQQSIRATVWVMPNYLAIGSDADHAIMPLNFYTATRIARIWGFILPTTKLVDEIYRQAQVKVPPSPIPPGPLMETNSYFIRHNDRVMAQLLGNPPHALVAGHKKDVVISNILNRRPGRIAIYGWHRNQSNPIQPLSTAHHAGYADYSHGIRLVNGVMRVNGRLVSVYDVLRNRELHGLLSVEGPIINLGYMMAGYNSDGRRK
jgi:hypothetical protein